MRPRRHLALATVLAAGLAGCGGDSAKTVTVAAPPPAGDTATSAPTTPAVAMPAGLPDGAIAVEGKYAMRIAKHGGSQFISSDEDGHENDRRQWVAKTTCASACTVQLRRELPNGAFETVTLDPVEGDRTRYASEATIDQDVCARKPSGSATRRVSVKASATRDVDGKALAIRLDGYVVVSQRCDVFDRGAELQKDTVQYRGTAARP